MKNIDKKTQRFLSLIPFVAFLGIAAYTYINFAKYKASFVRWVLFALVLFVFGFATHCVEASVSAESLLILNLALKYMIGIGCSLLFIELQLSEQHEKSIVIPKNIRVVMIIAVTALIICIVMSTAVPSIIDTIKTMNKLSVEDTNGSDNYSLVKITRDDLINNNECSILLYSELKEGNSSLIDDLQLEDCDYDKLNFDSGKFNGVTSVHATKTDKDIVKLDINVTLEKGNAELAIIVDGEYYCNVDINKHSEIVIENAKNKTIVLKAAGESADIRIEITRSYK